MRSRRHSVRLMLLMTALGTAIGCGPDLGISFGPFEKDWPDTWSNPFDTAPLAYFTVGLLCPHCGRDTVFETPADTPAALRDRRTLASVRIGIGNDEAIAPVLDAFGLVSDEFFVHIDPNRHNWVITSSDPAVATFRRDNNSFGYRRQGWVVGVSPGEAILTVRANNLTRTFVVFVED